MKEFLPPSYTSNEWLMPIQDRASLILRDFPTRDAVRIAFLVHISMEGGTEDLPFEVVFPSDDPTEVSARLWKTIRMEDDSTLGLDPYYLEPIGALEDLLRRSGADGGPLGLHASYSIVQSAAHKPTENWMDYIDLGRRWPQHAVAWMENLMRQFGPERVADAVGKEKPLFTLLGKGVMLAEQYGHPHRKSASKAMELLSDLTDLGGLEGLQQANRQLAKGFIPYRNAAYSLRGLKYEELLI